MKKIQLQVQTMYQSYPKSLVLGMIVKQPQVGKFYTQSYNVDRLEAALLEEGRIPTETIHEFIASLKPQPISKAKPKGNQLF